MSTRIGRAIPPRASMAPARLERALATDWRTPGWMRTTTTPSSLNSICAVRRPSTITPRYSIIAPNEERCDLYCVVAAGHCRGRGGRRSLSRRGAERGEDDVELDAHVRRQVGEGRGRRAGRA